MSMITVTCQDCGREVQLNNYYVDGMLATGELVKGQKRYQRDVRNAVTGELDKADGYVECIFDVCKTCSAAKNIGRSKDDQVERDRRIQRKINLLKEMRPDLTLEERVHAAVEEEFSPKYEPNIAFREFLTERYGL